MSRIVEKTAKGPFELKPQKKSVFICMCGLSKNQPFCDKSHLKVLDEKEGEIYEYDESGKKVNCCGGHDENEGGCCCQHEEK